AGGENMGGGVGKWGMPSGGYYPADMVDMGVGGDDRVDVAGIDPGLLEVGDQPTHVLVAFDRAHSSLEQGELVTGIDHEDVLVQHHVIGRQEPIVHHL